MKTIRIFWKKPNNYQTFLVADVGFGILDPTYYLVHIDIGNNDNIKVIGPHETNKNIPNFNQYTEQKIVNGNTLIQIKDFENNKELLNSLRSLWGEKWPIDIAAYYGEIVICEQIPDQTKYIKVRSNGLQIYEFLMQNQFDKITQLLSSSDEYTLNFAIENQGSLLHVLIQKYADSKDPKEKESIKKLIEKLVEKKFDQTIGRPTHPYPTALATKLKCPELVEILETEIQRSLDKVFNPVWDLLTKVLSLSHTIEKFEVTNSATKERVFLDEKGVRELLLDKLDVLSSADEKTQSQLDPAFIERLNELSEISPSSAEPQHSLSPQETEDLNAFIAKLTDLNEWILLSPERRKAWNPLPKNQVMVDENFLESLKPKDPAGNSSYSQAELLTKQGITSSKQPPNTDTPPQTTHVSKKMET